MDNEIVEIMARGMALASAKRAGFGDDNIEAANWNAKARADDAWPAFLPDAEAAITALRENGIELRSV